MTDEIGDKVVFTKHADHPERYRFTMTVYKGDEVIYTTSVRQKDMGDDVMDWLETEEERRW